METARMKTRAKALALSAAALAVTITPVTPAANAAVAGTTVARSPTRQPVSNFVIYAVHTQTQSADGTASGGVACPAGTLPVGGGTAVENPLVEHVAQAGFQASAPTGRIDGYQASVHVSHLPRGSRMWFTVQVACLPASATFLIYAIHTQVLTANGTSSQAVACPAGTLPIGGGTAVQHARIEQVTQAGFHASSGPGNFDGYQASAHLSGLRRGRTARFTVQVSCAPAALISLISGVHTQTVSADGITSGAAVCPAGTLPVGGGTAVQDTQTEQVTQAGFHASVPTGRIDGYQASAHVSGILRGHRTRLVVQVICIAARSPGYGPFVPQSPRPAAVLS